MKPLISIHTWVSLPNEVRYRIRAVFKIPRSSNTIVSDGVLETDGTTHEDLTHLTIEKMQDYVQDDSTDFHKLFDKVVAKITDIVTEVASSPTALIIPGVPFAGLAPGFIVAPNDIPMSKPKKAPVIPVPIPDKPRRKYEKKQNKEGDR